MFACILSEDLLLPTEVKFFTFPVLHSEKMGHLQQYNANHTSHISINSLLKTGTFTTFSFNIMID